MGSSWWKPFVSQPDISRDKAAVSITCRELFNIQNDLRSFFVLIDVRSADDYMSSHIDLAVNISNVKEIAAAATENQYRTATILYGSGNLFEVAEELAAIVGRVEASDESRSPQQVMFVSSPYNEYKSKYPSLCTDDIRYREGRLYPSQVDNRVYLSNYGVASNIDVISILGITHIVNCTIDCPFVDTTGDVSSVLCGPMHMLRVPVVDDRDQEICEHFHVAIQFIQSALDSSAHNKVLVHCKHGQSRSATVLAAWLIQCRGHTVDSSIQYLKSCRPKVGPNEGFIEQLRTFANSMSINT